MKKFLLCMMLAGLMMPVIAQEKMALEQIRKGNTLHVRETADRGLSMQSMLPVLKNTLVDVGGWKVAGTSDGYDRQSQGISYPMAKVHNDGFIGATWTNDDNPRFDGSGTPNRGVAYTYSKDGGVTWNEPDLRAGKIPLYWPSYAQWGNKGEAILARSYDTYVYENEGENIQILDGLVLMTRETRGEGKWTLVALPYPEGITPDFDHYMAWARMTTSGSHNQYIHIITPIKLLDGEEYEGYEDPLFYYRTQDGGATWDIEAELVPTMIGATDWEKEASYFDSFTFAVQGDVVACAFMRLGFHAFVAKTLDNGTTWTSTKFFHASARWYSHPDEYSDTCYIPTFGCVALDNDAKIHVAFGNRMAQNTEEEGYLSLWQGWGTSFLSYWNEDMDPLSGDDYTLEKMDDLMFEHFIDENQSGEKLYIKSTTPEWPIIGFFVPTIDGQNFTLPDDYGWIQNSYGRAGIFSFPQMAFDGGNKLHLIYLGILDGGSDGDCWLRHPYYTTRGTDGTLEETAYLVNTINLIDREFAYPTLAGLREDKLYMMAQVDAYAGVAENYAGEAADHDPVINSFYFFYIKGIDPIIPAVHEVSTPLTFNVKPNPASGQVVIDGFEGKGNVTVYNMLGQAVYHVENVENTKVIPLNDMAAGVYFVTLRSGNATATQKLIVQ